MAEGKRQEQDDSHAALTAQPARCPACGHALQLIWVHGHGQCATCGINLNPCCDGAPCPTPDAGD
jgi:predicted Zn-ribbon and HTH transcriptional regulator